MNCNKNRNDIRDLTKVVERMNKIKKMFTYGFEKEKYDLLIISGDVIQGNGTANELEEIVASFIRVVVNDENNEEDKMRVVRNCTKEDCLVERYRNKIESLNK